jgi:hypothetical protein
MADCAGLFLTVGGELVPHGEVLIDDDIIEGGNVWWWRWRRGAENIFEDPVPANNWGSPISV